VGDTATGAGTVTAMDAPVMAMRDLVMDMRTVVVTDMRPVVVMPAVPAAVTLAEDAGLPEAALGLGAAVDFVAGAGAEDDANRP
jgi:hypothetical protein